MLLPDPPFTVEEIQALPPDTQKLVKKIIDYYEQIVADLKAKLNCGKKTPRNSSLPPSSEHPHAKPKRDRKKSKRKRGGQHGHKKHERPLIPTEQCSEMVPLKPTECRRCGEKLNGSDPEPLRHQVWELPEIKPEVTEYQRHRLACPCCGETTCAELPVGVPTGQSGPRLVAFTALLMACFRQSKRRTALFLESIFNQPCCPALTVKMQNQATAAVTPAYQELARQLPTEEQVSIDESPTKQGQSKMWLWVMVARTFTVFVVRATKGAAVLEEVLTDKFRGIVNCDRAKAYWKHGRLQWCWAHLERDFQALIDSKDSQAKRLGHDLMRQTRKLFNVWTRYRDGTITWRGFQGLMRPVRNEIDALLLRGVFSGNAGFHGMCSELYDHREWLWTFVEHEGIEPTNNASERALRHGVIWRKLSFGTQSDGGSRFVETMLTTIETCRRQGRPVFDYLTQALRAYFHGTTCPSLVPDP
jgi:transposase